ncbi:hypothetical protein HPB50_027524 [Hyalomma asiaticum]|uniref:Uncharacterized protein n=1 Tax=Hyalomma asiaticum TaxID=266040 RepID=A0ACB7SRZ0_HYAAI|nr:hypothetical protein HPB50_027524 [Hyalomma asiaticum]
MPPLLLPRRLRFIRRAGTCGHLIVAALLTACCTALLAPTLSVIADGLPSRRYLSALGRRAGHQHHDDVQGDDEGHRSVVKGERLRPAGASINRSQKLPWFFTNGTEWPRPSRKLVNVWPDPLSPHDDRIVAQLMYLPPDYHGNMNRTSPRTKAIMLDGPWDDFMDGRRRFLLDRCPVDDCYLYNNYKDVKKGTELAAVVFKGSYSGPPLSTKKKQVWILHLLENPLHTGYIVDEGRGIDWVASYRSDSEIVTPYSKFVLYDPNVKNIRHHYDYVQNKTKMAAWFVSNCETTNKRLEYVHELQKYIEVGKNHNVIPVVMGASRKEYRAVAPYHSYIHVDDFASPKELAEYLVLLSRNRPLYNHYFEWKGTGEFINTYFWCRLCAMLHAPPPRPETRRNQEVYRWWKDRTCTTVDRSS